MTDKFESELKRQLADGGDDIDPRTRAALALGRRAAVAQFNRRQRFSIWWLPAGAVAAALLSVLIWWQSDPVLPAMADADDETDMEILLAEDNLEFYEELEFYEWMAAIDDETRDAG